ncbi:MAG: hypothetical protein K9I94_13835 [Bacteroidales bacterium]|nr:hypothetical protein [Bacteroidales bacterium]
MELVEFIEHYPSKENTLQLAKMAVEDDKHRRQLWELTKSKKQRLSRIAAWALEHCFMEHPELAREYIDEMVALLPDVHSDSLRRHFAKIILNTGFEEKHHDILANIGFEWLMAAERPVAVKVHVMEILYLISNHETDLKPELAAVIEDQLPKTSIGFKNRGRKLLNRLYIEIG